MKITYNAPTTFGEISHRVEIDLEEVSFVMEDGREIAISTFFKELQDKVDSIERWKHSMIFSESVNK